MLNANFQNVAMVTSILDLLQLMGVWNSVIRATTLTSTELVAREAQFAEISKVVDVSSSHLLNRNTSVTLGVITTMKYNKNIIALTALCLGPAAARAQPESGLAFKGGLNAATQAENFRVDRYGISGGVSGGLQWPLIERFLLGGQIELLYTPRGAETVFEGEHVGKVREHYVDFTVTARPEARLGPASIYLLLGGGLNLLVSANKDDAAGEGQDITGDLHRVDVALLGAAGVALHLPKRELGQIHLGTIFLEARHDAGLLEVDAVNGGFKNRTSSLMLGLSFVVGGSPARPTPLQPVK
jgi:hypothetical protein